jgi:hypothetical protein
MVGEQAGGEARDSVDLRMGPPNQTHVISSAVCISLD